MCETPLIQQHNLREAKRRPTDETKETPKVELVFAQMKKAYWYVIREKKTGAEPVSHIIQLQTL